MEIELIKFRDYECNINWSLLTISEKHRIEDLRRNILHWYNNVRKSGEIVLSALSDDKCKPIFIRNFQDNCKIYQMCISDYSHYIYEVVNRVDSKK